MWLKFPRRYTLVEDLEISRLMNRELDRANSELREKYAAMAEREARYYQKAEAYDRVMAKLAELDRGLR